MLSMIHMFGFIPCRVCLCGNITDMLIPGYANRLDAVFCFPKDPLSTCLRLRTQLYKCTAVSFKPQLGFFFPLCGLFSYMCMNILFSLPHSLFLLVPLALLYSRGCISLAVPNSKLSILGPSKNIFVTLCAI